jgi:2-polyprenyl-3-methyl-5-hydroxy-6-metoxy-1,4-benzoquinol methylase
MLCKSVDPADYPDLTEGIAALSYASAWVRGKGFRLDFPHPHRTWEYASAYQAVGAAQSVLDVGCGYSPLGPAFALAGRTVIECDPDPRVIEARRKLEAVFTARGQRYSALPLSATDDLPTAEAVTCISVLEHLPEDQQRLAWARLAQATLPGGALFITLDIGVPQEQNHDTLRHTLFTIDDVPKLAGWLEQEGMTVNDLDLEYHGNQVFNYSFYRIIAHRPEAKTFPLSVGETP